MESSLTLVVAPVRYARHQPETTLLYQLVERHYPDFLAALAERDRHLPLYVEKEFEAYLKCGRLEHGRPRFRRVPPPTPTELEAMLAGITASIARHLERRGLLVRDLEWGSRLRGWRSAVHKSGGIGEICWIVGRRGGKPRQPGGRVGQHPGLADSAYGEFEIPIPCS